MDVVAAEGEKMSIILNSLEGQSGLMFPNNVEINWMIKYNNISSFTNLRSWSCWYVLS